MSLIVQMPAMARADAAPDTAASRAPTDETKAALAKAEAVLARTPDDVNALYQSALFNYRLRNVDAARGRLERLVKLSGSYFQAWELMVEVTQAQGDLARRDEAIDRVKVAISTAIDPDIRRRADFVRERIPVGGDAVTAIDYFTAAGSDFTRYQFALGEPRAAPGTGLLLRTDAGTTEAWSTTALMPSDKQLFHLDMVDRAADGTEKVAIYDYYVGEPSYDTVRAKVLQILRGQAKPVSGSPGSLQGILKP